MKWHTLAALGVALFVSGTLAVQIVSPEGPEITISTGDSLEIICEDAVDPINQWKLNGMTLSDSADYEITSSNGGMTSRLKILSASQHSQGRYVCEVDIFTDDEIVVKVEEGEPEEVTIIEPDTEVTSVEAGWEISMKCTAGPGVSLLWYHKGMQLTEDSRVVITTARDVNNNKVSSLISVRDVTEADGGEYACKDEDDPLFNLDAVTVKVVADEDTGHVQIISPSESSLNVHPDHRIDLKCRTTGPNLLNWYHDNHRLDSEMGRITITEAREDGDLVSLLTVDYAEAGDAGRYKCSNDGEPEDEDSVSVTVGGDDGDDDGDDDGGFCLFCGAAGNAGSMATVALVALFCLVFNREG